MAFGLGSTDQPQNQPGRPRDYLSECERDFIVRALDSQQWQIQACADCLGISRKNLWEKMRKLGIDKGVNGLNAVA